MRVSIRFGVFSLLIASTVPSISTHAEETGVHQVSSRLLRPKPSNLSSDSFAVQFLLSLEREISRLERETDGKVIEKQLKLHAGNLRLALDMHAKKKGALSA